MPDETQTGQETQGTQGLESQEQQGSQQAQGSQDAQEPTPVAPAMEEAMRYVDNRFDRRADGSAVGSASGPFSVSGGTLEVGGLADGQWFWVEGSALNDGLWQYPPESMSDEDFDGTVTFLAVPRAFSSLCAEIARWSADNAEAISSPYQSESFGGYSYTMAGASSGAETPAAAWQSHFGARLRPFRKLSRDWV